MGKDKDEVYVYQETEVEEYTDEKIALVETQIIPHIRNSHTTSIKCNFNEDFTITFKIEKARPDGQIEINLKLTHKKTGQPGTLGKPVINRDHGDIFEWVLNVVSQPNYISWS